MTMVSFCELSTCEGAMAHLFVSHGCFSQNARFFQPIVGLQPKTTSQWNELNSLNRSGIERTQYWILFPRTRDPAACLKMRKGKGKRLPRRKWPMQKKMCILKSLTFFLFQRERSAMNMSRCGWIQSSFDWCEVQWLSLPAGCVLFLRWHTVHDARLRDFYDFSRMLLPCVFIAFFYWTLVVAFFFPPCFWWPF